MMNPLKTKSTELSIQNRRTRLKLLKINGFKSFKHAEIQLSHGFITIAGANGSGKSNIADSIRFVTGETSLKSLRARRSSDLVNHDSKEASVTLVFSAENKNFEIKRMIKPDGKNEYRINGKKVTRSAYLDLLHKYGLSVGFHNVIAQGQVEKIIEMSPKERRTIVDNVAGIAEYEEKKAEAFKELEKVEAKINDAFIVLKEREGFMETLEQEKKDALRYLEAKEMYQRARATLLYNELKKVDRNYNRIVKRIEEFKKTSEELEEELKVLNEHIEKLSDEKQKVTKQINESGRKNELAAELENLKLEKQKVDVELERFREDAARVRKKIDSLTDERDRLSKELDELENKIDVVHLEIDKIDKNVPKMQIDENDIETVQKNIEKLTDKIVSIKEKVGRIDVRLENIDELIKLRRSELEKRTDKDIASLKSEKEELERDIRELQNEIDELFQQEKEINKKLPELDKKLLSLKEKAAELRPFVKGLGASPVTTFIRELIAQGKIKGLYGLVEDVISFDDEYADAVVSAAGSRLQYVIVEDVDTATKVIELLKKNKIGRTTFIPLTRKVRGETIPQEVKRHDGFVSALIEQVRFDPKFYPALEYVFGSTIIVKDTESAKQLGLGKYRMVTMDGIVFERSGVLVGGANVSAASITARRRLESTERMIEEVTNHRKTLYSQLETLRSSITSLRKKRTMKELKLKEIETELKHYSSMMQQEEERRIKTENMIKKLENEKKELTKQKAELLSRLKDLENEKQEMQTALEEAKKRVNDVRERREKEFKELLDRKSKLMGQLESYKKEYELKKNRLNEVKTEIKQSTETLRMCKVKIEELSRKQSKLSDAIHEVENELSSMDEELKGLWDELNKLNEQIGEASLQKGKLQQELDKLKDKIKDLEIEKATESTRLADLKAEFEAYREVPLIEADEKKLKELLTVNEKVLKELEGNVNLKAPEMYDKKKQELDEIKEKIKTLQNEKDSVVMMINEIESKKRRIFMEVFTKVNENFKKLFKYIFEGEGTLVLSKPSDPLNSALHIRVRSGNREKYLEAMSGGEKSLLALIFLFSLQMTNPSPFYILDEAEAALDKENSKKMAELIRNMSKNSQFIVITHNDEVLRMADVAFGVSRTQKGSVVVGIQLNTIKEKGS